LINKHLFNASIGDRLHIIGSFENDVCIINQEQGFVITHPDILVSNTQLADSFLCLRKSVLQDRIRISGDLNAALVYGNMLHSLLQWILVQGKYNETEIRKKIASLIQENLETLYCVDEDELSAEQHMLDALPNISSWMQQFMMESTKVSL
jgi:hypothetical protein